MNKENAEIIEAEISKEDLVKSLDEAGHKESALLLKNWDELDSVAENALSKAVRQPWTGSSTSPMGWNPSNVEGGSKPAKWQGSDPRHQSQDDRESGGHRTRRGGTPRIGETSGVSELRSERTKHGPYDRKTTRTKSGKVVRWK